MFWGIAHGNPSIHEEQIEHTRKGDRSATMIHSTLVFKGEHIENEHWWLVEYGNGQVGYAPVAFLVVVVNTTEQKEESDATNEGQENSPEENRIGWWH